MLRGDIALQGVAAVIRKITHGIGVAARYGGEEMVIALLDHDAKLIAERIREQIQKEIGVTASLGVSFSKSTLTGQQLIDLAGSGHVQS